MVKEGKMTKGIICCTDNSLDEQFAKGFRQRLKNATPSIPIVSVSQKPIDFGYNICVGEIGRSFCSLWKQVFTALLYSKADIIYVAEHDVLYDSSHFDFVPRDDNCFYYNKNMWYVRAKDGYVLRTKYLAFSQCVCNRLLLLDNMIQRVKWCENGGILPPGKRGYEPGLIRKEGLDGREIFGINKDLKWRLEYFSSMKANIDIRHGKNLSGTKRFKSSTEVATHNRIYTDAVPGWGKSEGRFNDWFREVI